MKTISDIFTSKALKPYLEKTDRLIKLNKIWLAIGKPEWVSNSSIANFEKGCLTLAVDNAAWATRVRYASPQILKELIRYDIFTSLQEIKCKIVPTITTVTEQKLSRTLTPYAYELLTATATNLQASNLKLALQSLARRFEE
jgi:hypothetical protein